MLCREPGLPCTNSHVTQKPSQREPGLLQTDGLLYFPTIHAGIYRSMERQPCSFSPSYDGCVGVAARPDILGGEWWRRIGGDWTTERLRGSYTPAHSGQRGSPRPIEKREGNRETPRDKGGLPRDKGGPWGGQGRAHRGPSVAGVMVGRQLVG